MAHVLRLFSVLFVLSLAMPVAAQPSFRCNGDLSRNERAICGSQQLAKLDKQMADAYRDRYRALNAAQQRRLRARQATWLTWRDTCAGGQKCLTRRYQERLRDLNPNGGGAVASVAVSGQLAATQGAKPPKAGANDIVDRRVRDGRVEVLYGDGRIVWRDPVTGDSGTIFPDNSEVTTAKIQVQSDPVPPLPAGFAEWASQLEASQYFVIDQLLPEGDRAGYRDMVTDQEFTDRVFSHMTVIGHLVGP